MNRIKHGIPLLFLGLLLALGLWSLGAETTAQSGPLGVTSTPAADLPTPLPTEELTSTPAPTATPLPTAAPLPTATATSVPKSQSQPADTPSAPALPNLGGEAAASVQTLVLAPIQRIQIPELKVDTQIMRVPFTNGNWDLSGLGLSVGWLETSSLPGTDGNTVLISHLNLIGQGGGPFQKLTHLKHGDEIFIFSDSARYRYRVTQIHVVAATDVSILDATNQPQLILMTCFPYSWDETSHHYLERLVVIAEQVPFDGD